MMTTMNEERAREREAVEVVAVVKHDSPIPGYTDFMKYESWMDDGLSPGWTQLMTVAQHQRIMADMRQQRENLAELLREVNSAYTTAIHWEDMRAAMAQIDTALSELTQ